MSTFTMASYNVFRKLDADTVEGDLHQLQRQDDVDLMGLQEVQDVTASAGTGVRQYVDRMAWSSYIPKETRNLALIWNPDVWRAEPFFGVRKLSDKGPVKYTPPTWVIWHGLYHRPSQTRHLVYDTHVMRGYAKEAADAPQPQAWLDEAARLGLLRIVQLVASHMVDHGVFTYHHLLGDLNARQDNRARWWYPHPVLESLFARDTRPHSIDYMLHSHAAEDAGLRVVSRKVVDKGLDSDHAAQVKTMRV